MQASASASVRRSPDWLFAAASSIALGSIVWLIMRSGSWLDEYWQLWISGAPASLLPARLAADAHPPWFNLLARPVVLATGGEIVPARLVNLAAATAALGLGLSWVTGLDRALRWRMFLLVVASAGAVGVSHLAFSFRAYVWLLTLSALQAAVLAALVLRRPTPRVLAALVTGASVAIHYVHATGAIAIALVSLVVAWRTDRGAFRAIMVGLVAGIALDVATGLVQLPHWRVNTDVNWIAESGGSASRSLAALGLDFLTCNLVAAALLAVGAVVRRSRAALLLLAPIPLAFAGWLVLDAAVPMVVPRYMVSLTALLTSAAAVAWAEVALAPLADGALALLAALQPMAASFVRPPLPGWEAGARVAAKVTSACPHARLYAVSPWRFRGHAGSNAQRFEDPVIAFGYEKVGKAYGLSPAFVTAPTVMEIGPCPAIVWIEAAHGVEAMPPATILEHAQLHLAGPATARLVPTPNGAVLLLSRAGRLQ